jgi:hypothetical protein
MWAVLLPLPWVLVGLFAARLRRRQGGGCFLLVGVFGWPQAVLLQRLGVSPGAAWGISIAIMVLCPLIGYRLGMRLFGGVDPPPDGSDSAGL